MGTHFKKVRQLANASWKSMKESKKARWRAKAAKINSEVDEKTYVLPEEKYRSLLIIETLGSKIKSTHSSLFVQIS